MKNKILEYRKIKETLYDIGDYTINDFLFYLGITSINVKISNEQVDELMEYCKEVYTDNMDPYILSRDLANVVYRYLYMPFKQLKRVPAKTIETYYEEKSLDSLEFYFENYSENVTSTRHIKEHSSYTVARVVSNGYCVELHYCSDDGATIEYGEKLSHDYWENEIEEINWFNPKLSDKYVLNRLECIYENHFSDYVLNEQQQEELDLINKILRKHKVNDIEVCLTQYHELIAYDDENCWVGTELYDFLFNELFVYNKEGNVELINKKDFNNLQKFRDYREKANQLEKEMEIEYE